MPWLQMTPLATRILSLALRKPLKSCAMKRGVSSVLRLPPLPRIPTSPSSSFDTSTPETADPWSVYSVPLGHPLSGQPLSGHPPLRHPQLRHPHLQLGHHTYYLSTFQSQDTSKWPAHNNNMMLLYLPPPHTVSQCSKLLSLSGTDSDHQPPRPQYGIGTAAADSC